MNAWQQILKYVRTRINNQAFATWFKPTQFQGLHDNTLLVMVPNPTFESWMEEHYSEALQDAVRQWQLGPIEIRFHARPAGDPAPAPKSTPCQTELDFDAMEKLLNPKYRFDRFAVAPHWEVVSIQ